MGINELDVVTLKDGRQGTVLDIKHDENGLSYYLLEVPSEFVLDDYVREDEVTSVDWRSEEHKVLRREA